MAEALPSDDWDDVLVVSDPGVRDAGGLDRVLSGLGGQGRAIVHVRPRTEPRASDIEALAAEHAGTHPTAILAVGGGATIDTAKILRVLLQHGGSVESYEGLDLVPSPPDAKLVAVATTAGTGSETGYGAVYTDDRTETKRFIGSSWMIPDVAVVDPRLTLSVPPKPTAYSGLDALAQAIGPYLSPLRQPVSDLYALESVRLISHNLRRAVDDGTDLEARTGMAYGSLLMGLAMNNAECIGEHFFAEVVGPRYGLPHGLSVAMFLPLVLAFNLPVSEKRLARLATVMTDSEYPDEAAAARGAIAAVESLNSALGIPSLKEVGVSRSDLHQLAELTMAHFGVEVGLNPRDLTLNDCARILQLAWEGAPAVELATNESPSIPVYPRSSQTSDWTSGSGR
jgi:alcohol dehydrogenase